MDVKKGYPTSYRNPKCSRCRNHGFDSKMKGHKGFCPYLLCNCMKCILVEERRRISRQQILLQRHPDINVKDIFKGCIRCDKSCQQVPDYSNCVTADSFMSSPSNYPVVQQINGNQPIPSVNLPLNLQMPSTQPAPGYIYTSPQADFGYYTPTSSFSASNCSPITSNKMSNIHNSSSSSNSSSSTITTSANNTVYYSPPQMSSNSMTNSEFSPSYIYQSNSYQLARAPQNLGFGNYNRPAIFWNTLNYPMNSWPQKFCDSSVASSVKEMQIPENLSFKPPDNSMESCKLAADTTK